jgi:hypothetical protein
MNIEIKITNKEDKDTIVLNHKRYQAIDVDLPYCEKCAFYNKWSDWRCTLLHEKLKVCGSWQRKDKRNVIWKLKKEEETK